MDDLPFDYASATRHLTGLEILQGMLTGDIPEPPIRAPMNFRLVRAEAGEVEFRGAPQAQHGNPAGATHGGWYGALLDSAMGCVVLSRLPAGSTYTTLEYKVNILRAAPTGMEMSVVGRAAHVGRRTGVADAQMHGVEDGKLYTMASTTCIVLPI